MSTRYEYARSGRDKSVLLVFPEGTFEGLPFEIRLAAPWVGHGVGELSELRPADRWHFYQLGYAILRESQAGDSDAELRSLQAEAAGENAMRRAA